MGAGVLFAKASEASVKLAAQVKDQIRIERLTGAEAASQIWKACWILGLHRAEA